MHTEKPIDFGVCFLPQFNAQKENGRAAAAVSLNWSSMLYPNQLHNVQRSAII